MKQKSEILREILSLAKSELNENGNIGYTMPDGKHHIFIYVDGGDGDPDGPFYVIEPNKFVDGCCEPMGDTTAADYNNFAELLIGCEWCMEQFEKDLEKELGVESVHKGDTVLFDGSFKYWSNACGDLHRNGNEFITKDELPEPLKRAYDELWSERYSSLCYLVETSEGYGVALINEYDNYTASVKKCTMDELFSAVQADKEKVMKVPYYQNAKVYAGDFTGCDDCHELVVVFPADTPFEEFDVAAKALEFLAYSSGIQKEKLPSLSERIKVAESNISVLKVDKSEIERY